MYGLEIGEDDQLLVETLHAFAENELRGAARDAERSGATPEAIATALHRLGVTSPVPEQFGGQGVPSLTSALRIAEELAWGDPAIALGALTAGHAALLIAECGSEAQKARWLPRFVGENPLRASVLLYEGFGRQPSELQTRAEPADGGWTLRGEKLAVLHPNDAELAVVVAQVAGGSGLAAFVIEGRPKGWIVARDDAAVGKIALEAAPTGTIRLESVKLAQDAKLPNDGALAGALARVRLSHAAVMLGCARAAKEFAQGYANERVAFGRPIAAFQGVAFPLADRDMAIDAARMELFDAVDGLAAAEDPADIDDICRMVVSRCGEVVLQTTRDGVQTLGGHGFIREYPAERWYRAAAALAALDFDPLAAPIDFLPA